MDPKKNWSKAKVKSTAGFTNTSRVNNSVQSRKCYSGTGKAGKK